MRSLRTSTGSSSPAASTQSRVAGRRIGAAKLPCYWPARAMWHGRDCSGCSSGAGPLSRATPGPPSRSSPRSWGRASLGDGDHDQDDEEPGPVAGSTNAAGERDAGEGTACQRSAPPLLILRVSVRSFSTNSRPALWAAACGGRPRAGSSDPGRARGSRSNITVHLCPVGRSRGRRLDEAAADARLPQAGCARPPRWQRHLPEQPNHPAADMGRAAAAAS